MDTRTYRFSYVLIFTLIVAAAFLYLIGTFLLDIFLAAIFAGLLYPLFKRSLPLFGGRRGAAAAVIVLVALLAVVLPLAAIATLASSEAIEMGQATIAWVRQALAQPESVFPQWLVNAEETKTAIAWLSTRGADIVGAASGYLSSGLSSMAGGAARFFLDLFVILFALVSFMRDGPTLVARIVERIPLAREEARAIVDKTLRTMAGTLKGLVIVGAVQGILIGGGFAVAGLGRPWFWAVMAAFTSAVPGLGSGLVWIPGAIYLLVTGDVGTGIGLAVWGLASNLFGDNFLRAAIVGRGAAIPPFLVFISTLGGIAALGPAGILVGPVLAGMLIGVLDLYYAVLKSSGLLNGTP